MSPTNPEQRLRDVAQATCDALAEIASEWRADWSDFDGRTLQRQISDALRPLRAALSAPEGEPSEAAVEVELERERSDRRDALTREALALAEKWLARREAITDTQALSPRAWVIAFAKFLAVRGVTARTEGEP